MKKAEDLVYTQEESSNKALYIVFGILVFLLAATILVAYVPLGNFNLLLAGAIAFIKAWLVVWYFMHLRSSQLLVAVMFFASVFLLVIAAFLTFADYLTRS